MVQMVWVLVRIPIVVLGNRLFETENELCLDSLKGKTFSLYSQLHLHPTLPRTLLLPDVWVFPHTDQLRILQFNSILTSASWTWWRLHRLRAQSHKIAPHSHVRCQSQVVGPKLVTSNFCLTWLQIRGFHDPCLRFHHLLEWLTELRKTVYTLGYWFITKDILKNRNEQSDEEYVRLGLCPEGSRAQELLSPWNFGVHHPPGKWMCFDSPT